MAQLISGSTVAGSLIWHGGNVLAQNSITITPSGGNFLIGETHSARTDNPHAVTAAQVGALSSLDGVNNPGGNIDLVAGANIAITPDNAGKTITIAGTGTWPNADTLDNYHASAFLLLSGGTMTGPLTLAADPTQALHAATKQYVDAIRQGLDLKDSVRAATTANITLSGTQTIDGVAVAVGDRVLVKNQTDATQNGIYVVQSGAWTRAPDADTSAEVTPGMYVFVEEGTVNADSGWVLTTNAPITLGTTPLNFVQFTGAGQIIAGSGLYKSGNEIGIAADGVKDSHIDWGTAAGQVSAANIPIADAGGNYLATDVEGALAEEADARQAHEARTDNPHGVTAAQAGALVSVDGVSNAGGNVDLVAGPNIAITPDNVAKTITIGGTGTWPNADQLDGQHGSYYQNASNLNAGNLNIARMPVGGSWSLSQALNVLGDLGPYRAAPADGTNTTRDSPALRLTGAYWTGAASSDVMMQIVNDVLTTTPTYKLSVRDNAGAERFYVDNAGAAGVTKSLAFGGRFRWEHNPTADALDLVLV